MSTCAADRYVITITRLALERARALRQDLARLGDDAARSALAAEVAAGRAEPSRDFRNGDPQQLVTLGGDAPWGVALLKGSVCVTVLDLEAARHVRARAAQPVASRTCPKCGYVEASC